MLSNYSFKLRYLIAIVIGGFLSACSNKPSTRDINLLLAQSIDNLVFVQGGSYMMGDGGGMYVYPDGHKQKYSMWTGSEDTKPPHKVTLDSFYMQRFEVTYGEYDTFTKGTNRPLFLKQYINDPTRAPNIPAGTPSWYDAKAYCQWLGQKSRMPFDLPTEAQWEYAARSRGLAVPFATDTGFLDKGRNYGKRVDGIPIGFPIPIRKHPPNPLGLYDMTRNVYEWVNDWYDPDYYQHSPEHNPPGPQSGSEKVLRGGSNVGTANYETLYFRFPKPPTSESDGEFGMRCVLNLTDKLTSAQLKQRVRSAQR